MSNTKQPPRIARFILARILERNIAYGALGDLDEQFYALAEEKGRIKSVLSYWMQVLVILPGFCRETIYGSAAMLQNYLKMFIRSLKKHKVYSLINFAGLTIGICAFILILLFVQYEMNIDKFNKKLDRIYRVQGADGRQASMAPAIGKWISEQIPEAEKVVRFKRRFDYLIKTVADNDQGQEKSLKVDYFAWADQPVFDIFTFPLLSGDAQTALRDPFSLVLTEGLARRLYGGINPVGKTVLVNNATEYLITGVMPDPKRFHLEFQALASFVTLGKTIGQHELDSFNSWNLSTFVLLPKAHDTAATAAKITELFREKSLELTNSVLEFDLFPLKDYYFSGSGTGRHGNLKMVYIFIAIAVFILLIACVNFINLSTARASLRAREVGIKKVVGSSRNRLIMQFLSESVLFSLVSFLAALGLAALLLSEFSRLVERDLSVAPIAAPLTILGAIVGAVLVGVLSGIYPAFFLSAFKPISILKGDRIGGAGSGVLRKVLISFQFAISIVLIIGTTMVMKQISFVKNRDLGFDKEQIMCLEVARNGAIRRHQDDFKNRLLQHPDIVNLTYSQGRPGLIWNWEGFEVEGERYGFPIFTVDPNYFDVYGLEFVAGRNFSWEMLRDRFRTCILNETAVKELGLEDPVGKTFYHGDLGGSSFPSKNIEVIGVVKDFHFQSLHQKIVPQMFGWNPGWLWMVSVKLKTRDMPGTIAYIRDVWTEFSPEFPFEYNFIDDLFNSLYQNDERLGKIISYFAVLGVIIAVMGLFGLASFMAEQRTKEIGVRRVLGASIPSIVLLLSREFSLWVLIANIIAWPIAFFAMQQWLQGFAYRTALSWYVFLAAAVLALVIAVLTVSFQAVRAAAADPITALRYE